MQEGFDYFPNRGRYADFYHPFRFNPVAEPGLPKGSPGSLIDSQYFISLDINNLFPLNLHQV
jgi:hypothetical protein